MRIYRLFAKAPSGAQYSHAHNPFTKRATAESELHYLNHIDGPAGWIWTMKVYDEIDDPAYEERAYRMREKALGT